jgi:carbonic anhydrase
MCENCVARHLSSPPSRRSLLGLGAALALAGGMAGGVSMASPQAARPAADVPTGEEALKRLMAGNARYVANQPRHRDFSAGRAARASSQHPFASIVGCADSRLAPELTFDQSAGDLFVVRVAGNFVNEDGLASLEFGAAVLQSPLILVLGHTRCGAISATIDAVKNGTQLPGHLPALVNAIRPAVVEAQKAGAADMLEAATEANVRLNVERLKTAAPILAQRVAEKKLTVVGGVYDLATGKVKLI